MGEGYSGADLRLTIKNFQMGVSSFPHSEIGNS